MRAASLLSLRRTTGLPAEGNGSAEIIVGGCVPAPSLRTQQAASLLHLGRVDVIDIRAQTFDLVFLRLRQPDLQ